MKISYIITYILIMLLGYLCEFIIFGLWYRIHMDSSTGYFRFLRKMAAYCRYTMTHLPRLLEERDTDAPEADTFQWLFLIFVPLILPSFMLLSASWLYRIVLFGIAMYVVFEKLFRDGKTEAAIQNGKWIRFLYEAEDRPEGYASSKKQDSSREEKHPLSKEEIRITRIWTALLLPVAIALLVVLGLGLKSNAKHNYLAPWGSISLFYDPIYNAIFGVLLAIAVVMALGYLVLTPRDRAETKEQAAELYQRKKETAANYLGLNKEILIDDRLKAWESSILRMCQILKIRHAAVMSEVTCGIDMSGRIAFTTRSAEGIPTVVVSTQEIGKQRILHPPQVSYDMVRFLLGHELTHVRYRDYSERRRALKELGCWIGTFAVLITGFGMQQLLPESMETISYVCQAALLIIFVILYRTLLNDQYWRYVGEYRADRMSAAISGATDQAIAAMLKVYAEKEQTDGRQKKQKKSRFHPKLEKRLKELNRKQKWSIREYFRYAVQMIL